MNKANNGYIAKPGYSALITEATSKQKGALSGAIKRLR
jgi:hypothetical protein